MSFFQKIAEDVYETSQNTLIQSVGEQMAILFSNRNDKYWAFDFSKQTIVPLHDVFKMDYLSPEFSRKLGHIISIFDPRLANVKVVVVNEGHAIKIYIECTAKHEDEVVKIPVMMFDL